MKILILISVTILTTNFTYSQNQSKNREHCKYVINTKNSDRLETTRHITLFTDTQKQI